MGVLTRYVVHYTAKCHSVKHLQCHFEFIVAPMAKPVRVTIAEGINFLRTLLAEKHIANQFDKWFYQHVTRG